jgi:hypothetical protein
VPKTGSKQVRKKAQQDLKAATKHRKPSAKRSRAVKDALKREGHSAASKKALSRQARSAARKRKTSRKK